jgi:ceramide glucosyltransferase
VRWLAALPAAAAAAYYLLAIVAALRWRARGHARGAASNFAPPISLLKPVHGRDPRFYEAIRSHASQDYPAFEILFGTRDPKDPALEDIARLKREFPNLRIEATVISTGAPNAKVGVLAALAKQARYDVLLVNDSDIVVEPGYLQAVAAPLEDEGIGVVTCLYRARAESTASRCEALGIATEFACSVMVARMLGQVEFALGSTMVFRAESLRRIGGFEALSEFLADDYQLGRRIQQSGQRVEFAPVVVETDLGSEGWAQVWSHQLRWSRTIRVSRPGGYYGYAVTHATVWALVALAAGLWQVAAATLALRLIAGILTGAALGDRHVAPRFWLIPFRDLFGFATWLAGLTGNEIHWRGRRLHLTEDGHIREV